jgi:ubiquinone/menaquinone biosynthesis C-methylase UbiE
MKSIKDISLKDVQNVYSGPEANLWELIMGEQIHIGGFASSMELAEKAGIGAGKSGVDFCCCTGAGMRFLVRYRNVDKMTGVDATEKMIDLGRKRNEEEGLSGCIDFFCADVCSSGLPENFADFIWGEDAWCYVENKPALISEAARIVKKGGIIAFTDWIEGSSLSGEEAERFMKFMKFPNIFSVEDYTNALKQNGCVVKNAGKTGRFAPDVQLYLDMASKQLTYDFLKIIGHDMEVMKAIASEMQFMGELAASGKINQGLFIAVKS